MIKKRRERNQKKRKKEPSLHGLSPHLQKSLTSVHSLPSHLSPTIIKVMATRGYPSQVLGSQVEWPPPSLHKAIHLHSHNLLCVWNHQIQGIPFRPLLPEILNNQTDLSIRTFPPLNLFSSCQYRSEFTHTYSGLLSLLPGISYLPPHFGKLFKNYTQLTSMT